MPKTPAMQIAPGITVAMEGDTAVLRVDTTQDLGPSSTGKTNIVAKTGYAALPNGQRVNLTVTRKP